MLEVMSSILPIWLTVDKASLCMYIERRGGHGIVVIVVDWACRYVHFLDRVLFS